MNVLLIDDHALFREGIALLLQPLVQPLVAWEAGSCEEAFALLDARAPAVPELVLIDIGLPGLSGLEGLVLLRERLPQVPAVALSSADDRDTVLKALEAGAMGFIPKSSTSAVFGAALRLIMARGIYLPPSVLGLAPTRPGPFVAAPAPASPVGSAAQAGTGAAGAPAPARRTPGELGITPRQSAVLYLILQGMPAKLIGRTLDLAPGTVKAHTSAVLRALNVTTRTQAVIAAGRLGLSFEGVPIAASAEQGDGGTP